MTINVYRAYSLDNPFPEEKAHLFSIVTTENSAAYAIPSSPEIVDFEGLNDERIQMLLENTDSKPTTPLDWALLASQNMSQLDVIPVEDVDYETPEEAILSESNRAEDAWYFRNPEELVQEETNQEEQK